MVLSSIFKSPLVALMLFLVVVILLGLASFFGSFFSTTSLSVGKVNVDYVRQACLKLCTDSTSYEFCNAVKDVSYYSDEKVIHEKLTCDEIRKQFSLDCYLTC